MSERTIKKQQEQIIVLTDRLEGRKPGGAAGPATVPSDTDGASSAAAPPGSDPAKQVEELERRVKELEHKLAVVAKSRESDARKHRGEVSEARKQTSELRAEIDSLRVTLEAKDKVCVCVGGTLLGESARPLHRGGAAAVSSAVVAWASPPHHEFPPHHYPLPHFIISQEVRAEVLKVRELRHQLAPARPRSTATERRSSMRGTAPAQDPIVLMCIIVEETGPSPEELEAAVVRRLQAEAEAASQLDPAQEAAQAAAEVLDELIGASADIAQDTELRALRDELVELREDNEVLRVRAEIAEQKVAEYEASENTPDGAVTDVAAMEAAAAVAAAAEAAKKPGASRGARAVPPRAAGGGYQPKAAASPVPTVAAKKVGVPPRVGGK